MIEQVKMEAPGADSAKRRLSPAARRALRFLPLVIIALAVIAVFATGAHEHLTLEALAEKRDEIRAYVAAHPARAILYYMAAYILAVSLSLPGGWWFSVTGGFLFGWLFGGTLAVISAAIGACLIFLAAKTSFGDVVARRLGPRLQKLAAGFHQDAFFYLLFLRLVPVIPFWFTNLAPALLGVKLRTFAFASLIGIIPATFAFATAGDGLDSIVEAHKAAYDSCLAQGGGDGCRLGVSASDLITVEIVAAIAALGVLALLPIVLRRFMGRRFGPLDDVSGAP